jgi:SAM-dependent methyltransferase
MLKDNVPVPMVDDAIHVNMLRDAQRSGPSEKRGLYGLQWGNPNLAPHLKFVRDQFILPYINFDHNALEIGPGGGRWTRYLLSFKQIYVVDKHKELLDELATNFRIPHLLPILNNGTDFPTVPEGAIDFVFSFGVFVHLNPSVIEEYLSSIRRIVKPSANIVIQYSDKTKELARKNRVFSDITPDLMRQMVMQAGYTILEENLSALPHSSIMRFRRKSL